MNKKGFTLVEVLAVIVILGLIMVIVGTKGFGAFDNTKNKITELNQEAIIYAAELFAIELANCDDDLDKKLLDDLSYGSCEELNNELKNSGIETNVGYLKAKGYATGSSLDKIDDRTYLKIKKDENNDIILVDEAGTLITKDSINYYE